MNEDERRISALTALRKIAQDTSDTVKADERRTRMEVSLPVDFEPSEPGAAKPPYNRISFFLPLGEKTTFNYVGEQFEAVVILKRKTEGRVISEGSEESLGESEPYVPALIFYIRPEQSDVLQRYGGQRELTPIDPSNIPLLDQVLQIAKGDQ